MRNTSSGSLYVVATPIGNLGDISLRAIEVLKSVSRIIAEDTRHAQHLLKHYDIQKPLLSLHQFNERERIALILSYLSQGENLALISDAGTPLISDPGFPLIDAIRKQQGKIIPIPGACALIAALSAAGLNTTSFIFAGFFPIKTQERVSMLESISYERRTVIFYEAPHRIISALQSIENMLGDRRVVIARELTKVYEEFIAGSAAEILAYFDNFQDKIRGEMVLLIEGAKEEKKSATEAEKILTVLLTELPTKQAANLTAKITGENKKKLYQLALGIK